MKWLFLESYYGGSHRRLIDGLIEHLPFEVEHWNLPARKWKWRMHGAAVHFADRWAKERPWVDAVFTSSLLDVASLRGLLPPDARHIPIVLYFHENQLAYPVQVDDQRDYHYGWINIQSALAADLVLWNSRFNLESFLLEVPAFLKRTPDARPEGVGERIREKSKVLPVPIDARGIMMRSSRSGERTGLCRILWNHRWEHDKAPGVFFDALQDLMEEGIDFELAVLGERFREAPPVFLKARALFDGKIKAWGYQKVWGTYIDEVSRCDVVVSTSRHEFQGLSILDAAAAGVAPLVPDDLVYPEIWPDEYRYWEGELVTALKDRILEVDAWRKKNPQRYAMRYDWGELIGEWRSVLESIGTLKT